MKKLSFLIFFSLLFSSAYSQVYYPRYYPRTYYHHSHYINPEGIPDFLVNLDSTKNGFDIIFNMALGGPGNGGLLVGYSPKKLKGLGFFLESKFIMLDYNEEDENYRYKSATSGSIFNLGVIIPTNGYKKDGFRFYLGGGVNREIKRVQSYGSSYEIKDHPACVSFGLIYSTSTLSFSAGVDHRINGGWSKFGEKKNSMFNFGFGFRI
jgi:hypothetical protein